MEKRENINNEAMAGSVLGKLEKLEVKVRQMVEKLKNSTAETSKLKEENQRLRNEILAQTVKILELEQDLLLEQTKKQTTAPTAAVSYAYSAAPNEQDTGGGLLETVFDELVPLEATPVENQNLATSVPKNDAAIQQKSAALKAEIDQYIQEIDRCIEWLQQH